MEDVYERHAQGSINSPSVALSFSLMQILVIYACMPNVPLCFNFLLLLRPEIGLRHGQIILIFVCCHFVSPTFTLQFEVYGEIFKHKGARPDEPVRTGKGFRKGRKEM